MSIKENVLFNKAQLNELIKQFGTPITTTEIHNLLVLGDSGLDTLKARVAQQLVIEFIRKRTPQ